MVHRFFRGIADLVVDFVHRPSPVLLVCATLTFVGLVLDGTLFRLWSLNRDSKNLELKVADLKRQSKQLKMQILRSKDIGFMEMQARDRLELAAQDDLIFVFSDEGSKFQ